MKYILLINAFLEGLAGFVLIMMPHLLIMDTGQAPQTVAVSRLYGMLALIFGIISYLLYTKFEFTRQYKLICLVIVAFHFAVSLYFNSLYRQGLTASPGAFVLHLSVAVLLVGIYLRGMHKFPAHE